MSDVTQILDAIERGDSQAADRLLPIVYEELRRLAARRLAREKPQTLQATDLVHEAYLRLIGPEDQQDRQRWDSRAHFYTAAAEAMRRILIDRARRRHRLKHGGGRARVPLEEADVADVASEAGSAELLALDEALEKLTRQDKVKAELVKLRYFAGLTVEAAARLLDISRATADRYWVFARAWLYDEITRGDTTAS